MQRRALNWHPSPPDARDYTICAPQAKFQTRSLLPTQVDLSSNGTSVKDQGEVGSCTAFGTVGAMEYMEKKFNANSNSDIFSERFTYYSTRCDVQGWPADQDSGAYVRDALKSVAVYGTCKEASFPYNGDFSTRPAPAQYTEAKLCRATVYARLDDAPTQANLNLIRSTLAAGLPVVVGFNCYSNIWSAVDGVIPDPNGQGIGGHCVMLCGYSDVTRRLKFKNSWSTGWGAQGYGYLSYKYFLTGNISDMWVIHKSIAGAKELGFEINNPATAKQLMQQQLVAVMDAVKAGVVDATDRTKTVAFFKQLNDSYKTEPKIQAFILTLQVSFSRLSS